MNEIGYKFGNLTVIENLGTENNRTVYKVRCDCGTELKVLRQSLVSKTRPQISCKNCFRKRYRESVTKHGEYKSRLYCIWENMIQRCTNKNAPSYNNYGGRGISICEDWKLFINFKQWAITNGYKNNLTIDRVDNNGNYEPSNCRWVSRKVQSNNTRKNVFITYKDETKTISEWAKEIGINYKTLQNRITVLKWDIEKSMCTPINNKYSHRKVRLNG